MASAGRLLLLLGCLIGCARAHDERPQNDAPTAAGFNDGAGGTVTGGTFAVETGGTRAVEIDGSGGTDSSTVAGGTTAAPPTPPESAWELCQPACEAAEPGPGAPECGAADTVEDCVRNCGFAISEADFECGRCMVESLVWYESYFGCGEWECVCDGGHARFPTLGRNVCPDACAATLDRMAQERLSAPVPPSIGRAPQDIVEVEEYAHFTRVVAPVGVDPAVVAFSHDDENGMQWAVVAQMKEDLAFGDKLTDPVRAGWYMPHALAAHPEGDVLAVFSLGNVVRILRYRRDGSTVFDAQPALDAPSYPDGFPLARSSGGSVVLANDHGEAALLNPESGETRWAGDALAPTHSGESSSDVAIDSRGFWLLSARSGDKGPGIVVQLENVGDDEAPVLEERWRAEVAGDSGLGSMDALVVDAQDHVIAIGHVLYPGERRPVVVKIDPEGVTRWRWERSPDIYGLLEDVAVDAAGDVYVISTEDPTNQGRNGDPEGVCTVYGCNGLVVRKLAGADGQLLWEYQHREAASHGEGIAVDDAGRAIVVGWGAREEAFGLLLRFAP